MLAGESGRGRRRFSCFSVFPQQEAYEGSRFFNAPTFDSKSVI